MMYWFLYWALSPTTVCQMLDFGCMPCNADNGGPLDHATNSPLKVGATLPPPDAWEGARSANRT
jgi:hypothetical protein